jgi:hypothetical protein
MKKKLSDSFLLVGSFFILGGLLSVIGGALSMFRFLRRPETDTNALIGEVIRGMVLPHIFMFLGVGVISYGVILIAKGMIIAKRKRE